MWMIGNQSIQEAHSYDQGQHGLFTYQLLKGLGGAADLDKNGTIFTGELCTYTKGQVLKMAREQYGNEQEPLCLPGQARGPWSGYSQSLSSNNGPLFPDNWSVSQSVGRWKVSVSSSVVARKTP